MRRHQVDVTVPKQKDRVLMLFTVSTKGVKVALAAFSLCLANQVVLSSATYAAPAKKPALQLPANSALDEEESSDTTGGETPKPGTVLPPLKLTSDDSSSKKVGEKKSGAAESTKVFQMEESKNEFVPKGPAGEDSPLPSTSVVAPKPVAAKPAKKGAKVKDETITPENVYSKAKDLNVVPLALTESTADINSKAERLENGEQKQISELWEATLQRSPDIQFVVQKLIPSSDGAHTSTVLMRLVTSALYAGVGTMGTVMPGQGSYAMQNGAAQVLGQITGAVEGKNAKKAVLNQSEMIALYQMVRNTADKMVDHYRDYKKNMVGIQRANADFEDLKAMAAESNSRPLETEYTLRKQKRDIEAIADDVHRYRQNLIDMAGSEAVDKLDQEIASELQMLEETTPVMAGTKTKPNM
ncbi:MAG: hypothetical protein JSS83_25545 [Cyanobacteria bacterium SZAS LIN-3]|nr:hypothetical protein [Cyanobacteria bacterium SZAS LIN-3]